MNNNRVSISTITLARTPEEENLLIDSLQHLASLKIPVYVCDGGSGSHFLEFLHSFPHFTVVAATAKGVYAQAKNSILTADQSGCDFIFYTEPDKKDFFSNYLPEFLNGLDMSEQTGVVLASRSKVAFETFPLFQQTTEATINACCREIIGEAFDYTYGPFLLNRKLASYLHLVQQDIGWGWRPFIFSIARRLQFIVSGYEGNFTCPVQQRDDDSQERIYRMRQLTQNIEGLVLSTTVAIK